MEENDITTFEDETAVAEQEQPASLKQRLILFIVAGTVLLLDQVSKNMVEQALALYEVYAPFPAYEAYFRIIHATNTGMALGLFPDGSLFFGLMALLVSVLIIFFNHSIPYGNLWLRVALGLTLGGALGNLADRLRLGHVTDFFDFGPIPIFNIADAAVVCGAILLGFLMLMDARHEKKMAEAAANRETSANNLAEESSTIQ